MQAKLVSIATLLFVSAAILPACSEQTCASLESNPVGKLAIAAGQLVLNKDLVCGASSTATDPTSLSPGSSVESLMAPGGACAPLAGEDTCIACTKAKCCGEAATCLTDSACKAVTDCRYQAYVDGNDGSGCGTNDKLDAVIACLEESCATACPGAQ